MTEITLCRVLLTNLYNFLIVKFIFQLVKKSFLTSSIFSKTKYITSHKTYYKDKACSKPNILPPRKSTEIGYILLLMKLWCKVLLLAFRIPLFGFLR